MAEPRTCPICGINELPPRYRKCDDCMAGIVTDRTLTRPPKVQQRFAVVSSLRRVRVRPVQLACTCWVESDSLWQTDDAHCPKHGPTWVARISTTGGPQ